MKRKWLSMLDRLEFWLLAKLMKRHMENHMDQFDLYRMKCDFGTGYITFSMDSMDAKDSAYTEITL